MALSCHSSMDILCQERWGACRESSESLDSLRSWCSGARKYGGGVMMRELSISM